MCENTRNNARAQDFIAVVTATQHAAYHKYVLNVYCDVLNLF